LGIGPIPIPNPQILIKKPYQFITHFLLNSFNNL